MKSSCKNFLQLYADRLGSVDLGRFRTGLMTPSEQRKYSCSSFPSVPLVFLTVAQLFPDRSQPIAIQHSTIFSGLDPNPLVDPD